jgi:transcriptional regulator with XRE-family HTH domain
MGYRKIPCGATGETVRANIDMLRRAKGLTTTMLSEKLSAVGRPIEKSGVWRILNGERQVDVDDLVAFAAVFSVRPERLLAAWECDGCQGTPPAGFTCQACGQGAAWPA